LWFGWSHFGLGTNNNAVYTFSFLLLLYFAVFSVVSARERSWFWATLPSKTFLSALAADALVGTILTRVGLPALLPLPWTQTFAIFAYAMVSCLIVNDAVKVAMIKWRVKNGVVKKPAAKNEPKPEVKTESQPNAKTESKPGDTDASRSETAFGTKPEKKLKLETLPTPGVKSTPETNGKAATDLTPQIAARAYELYERRDHRDGQSVQDWEKAEQEIRENQTITKP
jgi:hypothetical protein